MITTNINTIGSRRLEFNGEIIEYLKSEYGIDQGEAEQVITMYSDSLRINLEALNMAINADDLDEIERQAHSVKGAFLNIGLEEQAELAGEVELAARNGESCNYSGMATRLRQITPPLLG